MKKSVLFICVDQWRWDCFSFMKHKNVLSPKIDKLAKIVNFIVFPRDGEEPKLNPGFKSHFIDYNFKASSTEVRNSVKINQKVDLPVDQNVLKYINENSLYSC